MTLSFTQALRELQQAQHAPERYARPFVDLLPVTGAAVSTLGPALATETLSATDDLAARLDELQFDLREGPCWDAAATRSPVLRPRLGGSSDWPAFARAAGERGVQSIFAFPLLVGPLSLGAIDLYSLPHTTLTDEQCRQAATLSDVIGRQVLRHAIESVEPQEPTRHSRRLVHQATGFVIAQLGLSPDDALLVIEGHAFAAGQTVLEVAERVVDGSLAFEHGDDGIEGVLS